MVNQGKLNEFAVYLEHNADKDFEKWLPTPNMFSIAKIEKKEIRHSNFLGWLLDPNENHGIEDLFFKKLISKIFWKIKKPTDDEELIINLYNVEDRNFKNAVVFRESKNDIDILFTDKENKFNLIIENKIGTSDHDKQLTKYHDYIKRNYSEEYNNVFVYLTPHGDMPLNDIQEGKDWWVVVSYQEVYDVLDEVSKHVHVPIKTKELVQDYMDNLNAHILRDKEFEKSFSDMYVEHQEMLNDVPNNRNAYFHKFSEALSKEFKIQNKEFNNQKNQGKKDKNGVLIVDNVPVSNTKNENFRIRFTTSHMDRNLEYVENKLFETTSYSYEFGIDTTGTFVGLWLTVGEPKDTDGKKIIKERLETLPFNTEVKKYETWGGIIVNDFVRVNFRKQDLAQWVIEGKQDTFRKFVSDAIDAIVRYENKLFGEKEDIPNMYKQLYERTNVGKLEQITEAEDRITPLKIYAEHQEMLDFLIAHKNAYFNYITHEILDDLVILSQVKDYEDLHVDAQSIHRRLDSPDFRIRFRTKVMDTLFNNSTFKEEPNLLFTDSKYFYEFGSDNQVVSLQLTVGAPEKDDEKEVMKKILKDKGLNSNFEGWEKKTEGVIAKKFDEVVLSLKDINECIKNDNLSKIYEFVSKSLRTIEVFEKTINNVSNETIL